MKKLNRVELKNTLISILKTTTNFDIKIIKSEVKTAQSVEATLLLTNNSRVIIEFFVWGDYSPQPQSKDVQELCEQVISEYSELKNLKEEIFQDNLQSVIKEIEENFYSFELFGLGKNIAIPSNKRRLHAFIKKNDNHDLVNEYIDFIDSCRLSA